MSINLMLTRLSTRQLPANSTEPMQTEDLKGVEKFINSAAILNVDPSFKVRIWVIFSLTLLMGGLNLIILIKNLKIRNYWLVKRDKNGYLNPNMEVLVPFFSVLNCSLFSCSIILLIQSDGGHISFPAMMTQLTSYVSLFYCAATRVWRTLSAIPLVPVQLTPRGTSLLSNGLPPFLFNPLLILVYISLPVLILPLSFKMSKASDYLGKEAVRLMPRLQIVLSQYQNVAMNESISLIVMNELKARLSSLNEVLYSTLPLWRVVCGIFFIYSLSLFVVFVYASARIYTTLTLQMQFLNQARRRFARMASVGMRSFEDDLASNHSNSIASSTIYPAIMEILDKMKDSLGAQSRNQSELLELWEAVDSCTENAELMRKSKISRRYRTAVLWQSACSSLIFLAFITLAACLALNVFGAPTRTSPLKVWFITLEWSGWASSAPGSILAMVSCLIVRESPHAASTQLSTVTSVTSARKPPPRDSRHQTNSSRSSVETSIVNLRPCKIAVDTTPPVSKATAGSNIKLWGVKIWGKLQPSKKCAPRDELPRLRRNSWFSFGDEEKASEKGVNNPQVEYEPNNTNECSGVSAHTITMESTRNVMGLNYIRSDINIIKSLRDPESETNRNIFQKNNLTAHVSA